MYGFHPVQSASTYIILSFMSLREVGGTDIILHTSQKETETLTYGLRGHVTKVLNTGLQGLCNPRPAYLPFCACVLGGVTVCVSYA